MRTRSALLLALSLLVSTALFGCNANDSASPSIGGSARATTQATTPTTEDLQVPNQWKPGDPNPVVTFALQDGGVITAELYPELAPNTVNSFISIINSGFFSGKIFHRVIPGFMIQGGSANGDGLSGSAEYTIAGEFASNGVPNNLKHTPGVLSMARTNDPNSASTQFFIMHADAPSLDGNYAAFGKVLTGMDVVDTIAKLPRDSSDRPDSPPVLKSVTVNTFDKVFPEPVKYSR